VVSRRLPHKSLFTIPTLLKSLSGDAEVAGTARCHLVFPKDEVDVEGEDDREGGDEAQ
jgi:hypothetical protein